MKVCPNCGTSQQETVLYCTTCGFSFYQQEMPPPPGSPPIYRSSYPQPKPKQYNRIFIGFIAFFFGGIGVHKFILRKPTQGLIYLLFSWTMIPSVVATIEAIRYWCLSDEHFQEIMSR